MEFLEWHYSKGVSFYIRKWFTSLKFVIHYFSLTLLLETLFSPWKRLESNDTTTGFNISRYFENLTFDLISRGVGAVVRTLLFITGVLLLVFTFIGGGLGIIIWLVFPFVGIPSYRNFQKSPKVYMSKLKGELKKGGDPFDTYFRGEVATFFTGHLGITLKEFKLLTHQDKFKLTDSTPTSYKDLIHKLLEAGAWQEEELRRKSLAFDDLEVCAAWWDSLKESDSLDGSGFGRPGIGLDLLFGYIPSLSQYATDLSVVKQYSHRLIGRDDVVARMDRVLSGGSSVILVGQPGVGKKTVVLEFAQKAMTGQLSQKMSFKRVMEFDYNFLLSGTSDLNSKKASLAHIFKEAAAAGNIILLIKNLEKLTNPEVEGYDFTDVFEDVLEKRSLKIIVTSTPLEYERFIAPNLKLRKYFETVEVTPPSKKIAMDIMVEVSKNWETTLGITITIPSLRKILDESESYITETPFPEKALELLDAVVNYRKQKGGKVVTVADANIVLSEKTGVSFGALTAGDKERLENIESLIHQRLVGQENAVQMIGKSLRGRSVGAIKPERPIGSFLFMGPTGVGKTETAKVLAKVYYGNQDQIIRFDMAEYAGSEGLERLIGSQSRNLPGALTTAIKNKPASLLLLDEVEKASKDIYNLFLTLLDEGMITDAFGRKINCRHLFVIATSNAGAEYVRELVSKGIRGEELQKYVINHILESGIFSPEFLNRFDGVIVYEPLNANELIEIAKLLLTDLAANLRKKDIELEVTMDAARKLAEDGYDPAFGARPMRRVVDIYLGDILGRAILSDQIMPGDKIVIVPGKGGKEYSWRKTN